jgi:hypothetical protein
MNDTAVSGPYGGFAGIDFAVPEQIAPVIIGWFAYL